MTQWLLRVEGLNFASTLYDTNDLSTVRGASIALLHAEQVAQDIAKAVAGNSALVFAGASQAAITFTAPAGLDVPAAVAAEAEKRLSQKGQTSEPFPHLDMFVDVVPLGTGSNAEESALERATALTRLRQFKRFTTPPVRFEPDARHADDLDGFRPATTVLTERFSLLDSPKGQATAKAVKLSRSVGERKAYGRKARQSFYRMEIALGKNLAEQILGERGVALTFTDDLEAMVEPGRDPHSPYATVALPLQIRNKIAVVYADGNSFGNGRIKAGSTRKFSEIVRPLQRKLLARLLDRLVAGALSPLHDAFALWDNKRFGLRFETLLWGGDEMCFVMPAWLAVGFVGAFLTEERWLVNKVELTHALGVAIADRKTPIRQLRQIAKSSADAAKEAGLRDGNSVTFDIFESLAPPDDDLGKARAGLFGAAAREQNFAKTLAFKGADYLELVKRLSHITAPEGFPRSQIYAALRAARLADRSNLLSRKAQEASNARLGAYARRTGENDKVAALRLPGGAPSATAGDPSLPSVLDLARIAMLWDYVAPQPGLLDILLPEAS